jgi:hypothetical protein
MRYNADEYRIVGTSDPRVPDRLEDRVPRRVLVTISEMAHDVSLGKSENGAMPGGSAGIALHGMLWKALIDAGEDRHPGPGKESAARTLASLLMGLAEDGDFVP